MQISFEGKIGILLGLLGLAGAGAIMIAPDRLWIGWSLIGLASAGGIGLGVHHFGRRFIAVPIAVCVLWWNYWYYSTYLTPDREVRPTSVVASASIVSSPTPAKPKLVSTMARVIFVCDSPKPERPPSLAKRKAELAERMDVMQKIFGYSVRGDVTDNEITLSATLSTATGSMKQDWLAKRTGDKIFVSIKSEMGADNLMNLFWALGSIAPLDPEEDFAKQSKQKVEEFLKLEPGKCKLV